jgi:cytochrome c oxidase accessory protein FixG
MASPADALRLPASAMNRPDAPAAGAAATPLYAAEIKVYPRSVTGRYTNWRWVMLWLTQLFFYGMPWLQWNGRQALLFDLESRRFFVGGLVLYPQDFIYLAALLVISALGLFFFTAVAGRLWCGYACPQTVYTEMFMWIERRLEGDRGARMRLDRAPWGFEKLWRKGGKHTGWVLLSLLTGFTFVGYFTPIRELTASLASFSLSGWEVFWVLFYGGFTYGNAGWMREQMCKYMCPYARFQSALIDKDSLIITYDAARGEPRGSRKRGIDARALNQGDCVDCTLCVQVCPTGIDIRKGLQNECIGCAACIDVCDDVMDKLQAPRGLIRYATANGVAQGWAPAQMWRRVLRPRVLIYGAVLGLLCAGFVGSIATRDPVLVDVIKDRAALARLSEAGTLENLYRVQLANRTERPLRLRLEARGLPGLTVEPQRAIDIEPAAIVSTPLQLHLPMDQAAAAGRGSHPVTVVVVVEPDGGGEATTVTSAASFYVPD